MTQDTQEPALASGEKLVENRVPIPTWDFWLVKLLAVTVGETFADMIAVNFGLGLSNTGLLMGVVLVGLLIVQFSKKRYVPVWYWLSVVLVSIEGTIITDKLVDDFGVSLMTTTTVFGLALAAVFAIWYWIEGTLSIHKVTNFRREAFYWLAILTTFALGTSAGDQAAEALGLGFLTSALMYAGIIAVIAAAYFGAGLNAVFSFWAVYIITRPAGASLGDWLAQPKDATGLGLGTIPTSLIFLVAIAVTIFYMMRSRDGVEMERVSE
ncbi:hypothetical protein [Roseibium aggregatum]|uniref:COG4705 family protein n=1 Tax=Roseibium aggregatum TaxID=187304 RepID=UPI00094AD6B1|nr:hypothetical protein [Roseibium aggregatum]UFI06853.1 hypothetical protein ST40_029575 [Roseibium aggregatum]